MKNGTTLNGFAKCENAKEIVNNSSYLLCYAAKAASLHESENVWNAKGVLDLNLQIRYYYSQQTKNFFFISCSLSTLQTEGSVNINI